MDEPTTLTIASVFTPRAFASRSAARLSAVSPDWLMTTTSAFSENDSFR